jgi:hypothetical protein
MKRRMIAATASTALVAALAVPAIAPAELSELGSPGQGVAPACPAKPCLAVSRTTGYQAKVGDTRGTHVVTRDGRIVAWTISLGKPGKKQTEFFNQNLGGEAEAQLTILRPGNKLYARVIAHGEPQKLAPWFGQTVQFPLEKSIPVKKGMIVGLTVPTWAPALAVNQPGTSSWRASRGKGGCNDFEKQTAQTAANKIVRFYCLYRTAQLTYSATLVSTPTPATGTTPPPTTTTPTTPTTPPSTTG